VRAEDDGARIGTFDAWRKVLKGWHHSTVHSAQRAMAMEGIDHDRVMGVTEAHMSELGLPLRGASALNWYGEYSRMWFNGDYALYAFVTAHPDYGNYVQLEYDVVLNMDVDENRGALRTGTGRLCGTHPRRACRYVGAAAHLR